jgi:hypothetical protein
LFEGNRSDISHSVIDIVWNDDGFDTNQSTAENPLPYLRRQEKENLRIFNIDDGLNGTNILSIRVIPKQDMGM